MSSEGINELNIEMFGTISQIWKIALKKQNLLVMLESPFG